MSSELKLLKKVEKQKKLRKVSTNHQPHSIHYVLEMAGTQLHLNYNSYPLYDWMNEK